MALRLARDLSIPALQASWLTMLGQLDLGEGRLEAAERHANAALAIARPLDHKLAILRGEWLRHQIVKRRDPDLSDRQRVAFLRKLYFQIEPFDGVDELREFRSAVIERHGNEGSES